MATLPRYDLAVLDNVPRAASGAQVYVYTQPTSPSLVNANGSLIDPTPWSASQGGKATIYTDNAGAYPLANPFTLDGNGNGWFYAVGGLYTVVIDGGTLAKPSILPDQNLILAASGGALFQTNGVTNSLQTLLNLVQGSNITLTNSSGNTTISGTAAPVTFKVNGTNAASQTILNLINGSGMTISDGGAGNITFTATTGLTLKVNGTPNGSQSLLNLKSGVHATVVDDGVGGVTVDSAYPVFQANSTPLTSSATVNIQQGTGITITNPSAGVVNIASNVSQIVQQNSVSIPAASLLTLNATPITIVGAQGAGTVIVPTSVMFEFNEVTAAFAGTHANDLSIYLISGTSILQGSSTGLLDQTVQTFEFTFPSNTDFFGNATQFVNVPLLLKNTGAAYTGGGTSALIVTVNYYVYTV